MERVLHFRFYFMTQPLPAKKRKTTPRLPKELRKTLVLNKAYDFFSEYGPSAKTRALADYCGVSQRLLYSLFPNKAALLSAVYASEISGPIKTSWFGLLTDRHQPIEQRLQDFYREYYDTILTRKWLRFFLFTSLEEGVVAPQFISEFVTQLVELIVTEVAIEKNLPLPANQQPFLQELGWVLHGSISHLAIRSHIYDHQRSVEVNTVIDAHVQIFVAGFTAFLALKQ